MLNHISHYEALIHRVTKLPLRIGFGLLLCANFSCTSTNSVARRDSLNREQQGPMAGSSPLVTQGNHRLLEQKGDPLGSTVIAQRPGEWPAVPEQRVGFAPPQYAQPQTAALQQQLPPGGYRQPIGQQQPWTQPMARITSPPAQNKVAQVSHQQIQASNSLPQITTSTSGQSVVKTPAYPRLPLNQVSSTSPIRIQPGHASGPVFYPDEYLSDGGDRNLPVHYSPGYRQGFDTQDTIVEYKDNQGKQHVRKSNETHVYAPRFAAVTTTAGISESLSVDRALGAYETVNGLAMNTRIKPNIEQQTDQIKAARVRTRVSGLESEDITLGMIQATKLEDHTKLINTNTDFAFTGFEKFDRWQTSAALDGIQAAAIWTRKLSPVIIASDAAGTELYSSFRPEKMVGLDEKYKSPGKIYIDKSADKSDASPGDIITFTIRYKNTGDRSLNNVLIADNLTPRLEFIEGSGESDRDGKLIVEDNLEGSLILKWEFDGELEGHAGGTVSFKAKVR
ncbi:MAG: DUF11 domain-containing protein [Planctomycetaceae bacterium]|nr:DUF11 domain-containing protein [Planctomycetaceae bacterium]